MFQARATYRTLRTLRAFCSRPPAARLRASASACVFSSILFYFAAWLVEKSVQKLVVVIAGQESGKTLERWCFDVRADEKPKDAPPVEARPEKELTAEIQAIIRQITASVTFLPLLDEPCSFDLLVYTDTDVSVPTAWEESDPKYIAKSEEVKLRSFTTKIHRVDAAVSYLAEDD